jgi:hypothetical protein
MKRWYKRPVPFVALSLATLLLTLFTSCYVHDSMLERKFPRVSKGMTEQQVVSILGRPDDVGRCGEFGGIVERCAQEYVYHPRQFYNIVEWVVFLDEQGIVVDTYKYMSW